jgi:hypothetical protein
MKNLRRKRRPTHFIRREVHNWVLLTKAKYRMLPQPLLKKEIIYGRAT